MQNKQQLDRLKPDPKSSHDTCKWSKSRELQAVSQLQEEQNTQPANTDHHRAGVAALIPGKVGFRAKNVTKGKEDFS